MLGITIGVASITTILALGAGAGQIVGTQVDALGGNIAIIRPGVNTEASLQDLTQLSIAQQYTASTLTVADIATIESTPNVVAAAPITLLSGTVKAESSAPIITSIVASTQSLANISDLKVQTGDFLDPTLSPYTAVIGAQLSVDIFGTEDSLGKTLVIRGQSFTVIGILKHQNTPINYNGVDFDKSVIISDTAGRALNQGASQIQQINIKSDTVAHLDQVIIDINKALLKNHLGEADFSVLSGDQIAEPTGRIFTAIAGTITAVAAISLLVGGIGVMNIMLVSVAERTREIGIRKALGASNNDIVTQFLIESLALSIGGGIGGYIIGYILAFGISTFLPFSPVFTWQIGVIAVGLSILVGTVFGLYPAIRASRKDPIDALRQYD